MAFVFETAFLLWFGMVSSSIQSVKNYCIYSQQHCFTRPGRTLQ